MIDREREGGDTNQYHPSKQKNTLSLCSTLQTGIKVKTLHENKKCSSLSYLHCLKGLKD